MSGSIGGSRILRNEVQQTYESYINNILKGFPGFVSATITGSYNAGIKKDHGDIDLVVLMRGSDIRAVKKDFKSYLDSLNDSQTPRFKSGRNLGKKSQLYGQIVTCGYPISGRFQDYVQIDNIIVLNNDERDFQTSFLNLDAPKQSLLMGLVRVTKVHNQDISLSDDQELEYVLSGCGLSLRVVTLDKKEYKEISHKEIWRSHRWKDVTKILSKYDLSKSFEDLLEDVSKGIDERSGRRIFGIMRSMINVGVAEVGTPKGLAKESAIKLAESKLLKSLQISTISTRPI